MDVNQRIKCVRVTNTGKSIFTDRYDGVPFQVFPGKSDTLPIDMAGHFFGPDFDDRDVMFRHIAKRQGWNTPDMIKPGDDGESKAEKLFASLKIEAVTYKLVPEESPDPRKPVPAEQDIREDDEPRRGPGRPRKSAEAAA
jgi:hypothetical protein